MLSTIGFVLAAVASMAHAEVILLSVGGQRLSASEHAMLPRVVRANKGDTISFTFQPNELGLTGNHTIVQTSAAEPCTPLAGGFSSPIVYVPGTSFNVMIDDDTQPIYFACGSTDGDHTDDHCQQGEVGVINPLPQDLDPTDPFEAGPLVAQAEAAAHDGAMGSVPAGGSVVGSGVGAHVVGTFPPQHTYDLPGDIYPTSTNGVPATEPTASASISAPSSNLSVGAIAGIALGAVAFLALIAALVARGVLMKRRKAKTETFAGKVEHTLRRDSAMVEAKKPSTLDV